MPIKKKPTLLQLTTKLKLELKKGDRLLDSKVLTDAVAKRGLAVGCDIVEHILIFLEGDTKILDNIFQEYVKLSQEYGG